MVQHFNGFLSPQDPCDLHMYAPAYLQTKPQLLNTSELIKETGSEHQMVQIGAWSDSL